MIKQFHANEARLRRHQRIRSHLIGSETRPRLNVFRSGQHIYAQVIDDTTGQTLVSASSLDETLRNFKPAAPASAAKVSAKQEEAAPVVEEVAAEAAPAKGKKAAAKGGKQPAAAKTVLPAAEKHQARTPVEELAAIANNRKVALAREVGKLVAQRAKEKGVSQVIFDRGGYAYHGRVAALAEGAREVGLDF
jgi:large subunit ribosomal protein L18